jgi:hypothetical protein
MPLYSGLMAVFCQKTLTAWFLLLWIVRREPNIFHTTLINFIKDIIFLDCPRKPPLKRTVLLPVNLLRYGLFPPTFYRFSILSMNCPINVEVMFHTKTLLLYDERPQERQSSDHQIVSKKPGFPCTLSYRVVKVVVAYQLRLVSVHIIMSEGVLLPLKLFKSGCIAYAQQASVCSADWWHFPATVIWWHRYMAS